MARALNAGTDGPASAVRPYCGQVLRALREARGLTREAWADFLGYGLSTLKRWESGEAVPDAAAEAALLALCQEKGLFRRYDAGRLQGVTLTPAWLSDLFAEARLNGAAAPPQATRDDAALLPSSATDRSQTNLPVPLTRLIGRDDELAAVARLLTVTRLLTLTGPGGTGKTRVALAAAEQVRSQYADGVWFVDLSAFTDPALVVIAIARVLGVRTVAGQSLAETLKSFLRHRRLLLVLDNFEQAIEAAPLVQDLLAVTPDLHALVTSRVRLRLNGEQTYPIAPLPVPTAGMALTLATIAANPAVELFVARVQALRPDFTLTLENAAAVASICKRLDGLPLALELAAARTTVLTVAALLARLEPALPLLTSAERGQPARQQTLRRTIQWSWDLLDPPEQALLRRLAVFAGGDTLAAVELVCNPDGDLGLDVLDGLASLVENSLVQRTDDASGEPRYAMLATVREFAIEQLAACGEQEDLRQWHADYYGAVVEQAQAAHQLSGRIQADLIDPLDAEADNVLSALRRAVEAADATRGLRLAGSAGVWLISRVGTEARIWVESLLGALGVAGQPQERGIGLAFAGHCAINQGDLPAAVAYLEEAITCFRATADKSWLIHTLCLLSPFLPRAEVPRAVALTDEALLIAQETGEPYLIALAEKCTGTARVMTARHDLAAVETHLTAALTLAEKLDADWLIMATLTSFGMLRRLQGRQNSARDLWQRALTRAMSLGDRFDATAISISLAVLAMTEGDDAEASVNWRRGLVLANELTNRLYRALCLAGIAAVLARRNRPESAARLLGAIESSWLQVAPRAHYLLCHTIFEDAQNASRTALGSVAFEQAWAEGRLLGAEAAVEVGLTTLADLQFEIGGCAVTIISGSIETA